MAPFFLRHDDAVWAAHPRLRAVAVVVEDVLGLDGTTARQEALRAGVDARVAERTESAMPEIAAWRDAFAAMGLKPTQYRCASEALLRRYRKHGDMPVRHPLVDYLNFVSMRFAIPVAALDVGRVAGGLTIRPAHGTEKYETFQGAAEHPAPGEIVYVDEEGHAHSRRWAFRQSARSVVTDRTGRVLVVAEALHENASEDLDALESELLDGLGVHCGPSMRITPDARLFEFEAAEDGALR
ncbi:B3/B4 domain-containing protein [Amycolatopsis minnesotensis]|uniref:Phenylalanine--tRNA ligase beta subunit-related protein n=1 Tax=Amycolatopsis minnesotensis TaxID=337894 RepID=A0ABP5C7K6_9PSEU